MPSSVSSVPSSPDSSIGGGRDEAVGSRSLDLDIRSRELDLLRLRDFSGDVLRDSGF